MYHSTVSITHLILPGVVHLGIIQERLMQVCGTCVGLGGINREAREDEKVLEGSQ